MTYIHTDIHTDRQTDGTKLLYRLATFYPFIKLTFYAIIPPLPRCSADIWMTHLHKNHYVSHVLIASSDMYSPTYCPSVGMTSMAMLAVRISFIF